MRKYEAAVIYDPNLEEEALEKKIEQFKQMVAKGKGKIIKVDNWGRKKISYPIKKQTHGNYCIFYFELQPESAHDLENSLRISDDVLRHLIIKEEE